jgi:F-type H+-transporting ATPase subunit gamma
MASTREMRLRIRSVKNIAQVTRALETVSASYVRKTIAAVQATRPYAEKAFKLLEHLARQPGHENLHPLLQERTTRKKTLVLMVSSDRGLAGAFNVNIVRAALQQFRGSQVPVAYLIVGRKGHEMMQRRGQEIYAVFHDLPSPASYMDVSAIGRLVVDEYLQGKVDQVFIAYTQFETMMRQPIVFQKLLPFVIEYSEEYHRQHPINSVFTYEPDEGELLDQIVPRFTSLQVYKAILSSQASEHAARMIAMRNASDNAQELIGALQLEYNKIRQQGITNDILDIVGGVEALAVEARGSE